MHARHYLVAAILGSLGSLIVIPSANADRDRDFDEEDGPEAEAILPIKLDDLIEVAVRLSPDLTRAKLDRTAARGTAGAARANQQWVLGANANYKRDAVGDDVTVEPFQVVGTDRVDASVSLGRNLPTGGSLSLELGVGHTTTELDIPDGLSANGQSGSGSGATNAQTMQPGQINDTYTQIQTTARITLKQPLVRGFGPDVTLAGEKKADLASAEATVKTQLAAEDMLKDVIGGYWELAYASFEVDTLHESLDLALAQEKLTREEVRAGQAPQNQLNAVIYEIAVRKEAALRAELELEHKSLDLRRKVGLELGRRQVLLRPGEKFEIGAAEWDVEDVLARSHRTNRRLASLALEKKIADVDVAVAKNATLPQVDLNLSGAVLGVGPSSDDSIRALQSADGYEITAGLAVSFELSGSAKAAHTAATARRRRLDIDRADLERQIDTEVVNAVHTVTASRTRVSLAEKAIDVADDNLKAERLSFQAGKSTNFNVMQRQTQLIDARLRRGRAIADYHVAVAQLQYMSGTLLEQYRVNTRSK